MLSLFAFLLVGLLSCAIGGFAGFYIGRSLAEEKLTKSLAEVIAAKEAMRCKLYAAEDELGEAKARVEMMSMGSVQ
jgi:membrane protein DedA with SNARE-associated domain